MNTIYDLLIVGGGPAGISAAIYSARKKIKCGIFTGKYGGQISESSSIENYLGFQKESGVGISEKFSKQLDLYKNDISIKEDEFVTTIKKENDIFTLVTSKETYFAKNVILATGRVHKKLNIPGEEEFASKGVAYCATCDAPIFTDEHVAIVGGGNSAMDAVLQLIEYAEKIYLIDAADTLIADSIQVKKIEASDKVVILNNTILEEIKGDGFVSSIVYTKNEKREEMNVAGVFIEIGSITDTSIILDTIAVNEIGDIIIDDMCMTNIEGMFAAGDVSSIFAKQAIIAAGEGAKASIAVYERIKKDGQNE